LSGSACGAATGSGLLLEQPDPHGGLPGGAVDGAVLHTLNIRLFPEQLAYVINHAEDSVIIVDGSLAPLLARVYDTLTRSRR